MDEHRFDRLTCALGRATSPRAALVAVLGGGVWNAGGTLTVADPTIVTGNVPNN
jgi:hypothetical protein